MQKDMTFTNISPVEPIDKLEHTGDRPWRAFGKFVDFMYNTFRADRELHDLGYAISMDPDRADGPLTDREREALSRYESTL